MTHTEILTRALELLAVSTFYNPELQAKRTDVIEKGLEALAQPEQEPVAWMDADGNVSDNNDHKCFPIPLHTTPPQRKPLTEEDCRTGFREQDAKWTFRNMTAWQVWRTACEWNEAAHGIKEDA